MNDPNPKSCFPLLLLLLLGMKLDLGIGAVVALRGRRQIVKCLEMNSLDPECQKLVAAVVESTEVEKVHCTPEQIRKAQDECIKSERMLLSPVEIGILAFGATADLVYLWTTATGTSEPVSKSTMSLTGSVDSFAMEIVGGDVLRDGTMSFKGIAEDRDSVDNWEYDFTLTFDGDYNEEVHLNGIVTHLFDTHKDHDQKRGNPVSFDLNVEGGENESDSNPQECAEHPAKDTEKPDHFDCITTELKITQSSGLLGVKINAFLASIVVKHQKTKAKVGGDPHFTTWSGDKFDFHGECDLVLVHNKAAVNGLGIDIHARTKIFDQWSKIIGVAVRIGDDVLEFGLKKKHWINGVANVDLPATVCGYAVTKKAMEPDKCKYIINLGGGEKILVNIFQSFMWVVVVEPHVKNWNGSLGLLGEFGTGHKVARNGKSIVNSAAAFGKEWQVSDADPVLFRLPEGPQFPQQCNMPDLVQLDRHRLRSTISHGDAAKACAHVNDMERDDCIFDVMATNDVLMAWAYDSSWH